MINNLERWNAMAQPPPTVLKPITGGRLKGKTDISPQWRYEIMTEQYGPCGIGWKYDIVKTWTEPGPQEQVFVFALVNVIVREGEVWSDPIPGIGGSMLIELEKGGLHANDEGYKMAVTDALSVALKMLGVAADVYNGSWDGSKYNERPRKPKNEPPPATKAQIKAMYKAAKDSGWSDDDAVKYIKDTKGVQNSSELDKNEVEALTDYFKRTPPEKSDGPPAQESQRGDISKDQMSLIQVTAREKKWTDEGLHFEIHKRFKKESLTELTKDEASQLIEAIQENKPF